MLKTWLSWPVKIVWVSEGQPGTSRTHVHNLNGDHNRNDDEDNEDDHEADPTLFPGTPGRFHCHLSVFQATRQSALVQIGPDRRLPSLHVFMSLHGRMLDVINRFILLGYEHAHLKCPVNRGSKP